MEKFPVNRIQPNDISFRLLATQSRNIYETLKVVRDALEFTDYIKEKHPKVYEEFQKSKFEKIEKKVNIVKPIVRE